MSQIDHQSGDFDILKAAAEEAACAEALASVRDELVRLPQEGVLTPGESVVELVGRVLALAQASRPAGGPDEGVRLARLEVLALALARAQHEYAWESPRRPLPDYDRVVVVAERKFRATEGLVAKLVRRGRIERGLVPRPRGTTLVHRCERALELIDLLHDHGRWSACHSLERTAVLAHRLLNARPMGPGELTPTAIRDRAYTVLSRELASHEATRADAITEDSGVFAVTDLCGPALARCA